MSAPAGGKRGNPLGRAERVGHPLGGRDDTSNWLAPTAAARCSIAASIAGFRAVHSPSANDLRGSIGLRQVAR
jgi:hypothetical protein